MRAAEPPRWLAPASSGLRPARAGQWEGALLRWAAALSSPEPTPPADPQGLTPAHCLAPVESYVCSDRQDPKGRTVMRAGPSCRRREALAASHHRSLTACGQRFPP